MRVRYLDYEEDMKHLNPDPWQLSAMGMNPGYVSWGVGEDYMPSAGRDGGWSSSCSFATWDECVFGLDDLNECVNFYFFLDRDSRDCPDCEGQGQNPATKEIADSFYNHSSPTGEGWHDKITQDEVQALLDHGRLHDLASTFVAGKGWQPREDGHIPTAEEVNAWQRGRGLGHDAINRWILIEARATRLGVYGKCARCQGEGMLWTSDWTKLGIMLWILHPRKGCSRGVEVLEITETNFPKVITYLKTAATRNADRFSLATTEQA